MTAMKRSPAKGTGPLSWLRAAKAYLDGPGVLPWVLNVLLAFVLIKFVLFPGLGLAFGSELPVVAVMSGSMEHEADAAGMVCGRPVPASYDASFNAFWDLCGDWYASRGIDRAAFEGFTLHRGFDKGDIMVILGPGRGSIDVGDVIVFRSREPYPIIHRVVAIDRSGEGVTYQTKGDHNPAQIVTYVVTDGRGLVAACHREGAPVRCSEGLPVTRETPGAIPILDETRVKGEDVIGHAVLRIPWLGWVRIWATDALAWALGR
jgi:signal peptidase I